MPGAFPGPAASVGLSPCGSRKGEEASSADSEPLAVFWVRPSMPSWPHPSSKRVSSQQEDIEESEEAAWLQGAELPWLPSQILLLHATVFWLEDNLNYFIMSFFLIRLQERSIMKQQHSHCFRQAARRNPKASSPRLTERLQLAPRQPLTYCL